MKATLEIGMTLRDPVTERDFVYLGVYAPKDTEILRFVELQGDDPPCSYAWRPNCKFRNDTDMAIQRALDVGAAETSPGITGELIRLRNLQR